MYTTTLFLIGLFLVNSSNASTQSPDECVAGSCSKEFVEVQTECGPVQGKRFREQKHFGAKTVDVFEFRNIPYARPPVEELRWRPPVPLSRNTSKCWTGTLGYEQKSVACSQSNKLAFMLGNAEMSEDCLVLTVRTPVQPDPRKKLPGLDTRRSDGLWQQSVTEYESRSGVFCFYGGCSSVSELQVEHLRLFVIKGTMD